MKHQGRQAFHHCLCGRGGRRLPPHRVCKLPQRPVIFIQAPLASSRLKKLRLWQEACQHPESSWQQNRGQSSC